jgi:hypothetical protein
MPGWEILWGALKRYRIRNAHRSVVTSKCNNPSIILDFAASRVWFDFLLRNGTYSDWYFPQWLLVLVNKYTLLVNLETGRLPGYSYLVQKLEQWHRAASTYRRVRNIFKKRNGHSINSPIWEEYRDLGLHRPYQLAWRGSERGAFR